MALGLLLETAMRLFVALAVVLGITGCASLDGYGGSSDPNGTGSGAGGGKADGVNQPLVKSDWRLPWSCGERYYVSQGNDGDLCNATNGDHIQLQEYSWDFALPRHTPVRATRDGMVTLSAQVT